MSMRVESAGDATSPEARTEVTAPAPEVASGRRPAAPGPVTAADAVRQLAVAGNRYGTRSARPSMPGPKRAEPRRLWWTAAAVVVIGAVTGVAVAEAPAHPGSSTKANSATSAPSRRSAPTSHTSTGGGPSSTGAKNIPGALVGPSGLDPVTSSTSAATYRVAGAPYTVVVSTTTGACWIEATDTTTGRVLWEGTLSPGASQSIPANDGIVLRLGNSLAASVTEGGQSVRLPPGAGDVFELTFEVL